MERQERRKQAELRRQERLREIIYENVPGLPALDQALRQAVPAVLAAAFRRGEDPTEAVAAIRAKNLALQKERRALLGQYGYREEDLDGRPLCPLCHDSGWQGSRMCACLKALCQEEQNAELSALLGMGQQSFSDFRLDLYEKQLWADYGRSPRQNMERVLALAQSYARPFGKFPVNNLLFYGGTGLGKTYLSACIAREVSAQGHSVVYDSAANVFARFEEQKFSRDAEDARAARDLTRKYLRCALLILDDLGSELTTPFVQSALYQLVNTRLTEGLHTVVSTNYSMDELRKRYSPQIISRLEGAYEPVPFFGADIRLLQP